MAAEGDKQPDAHQHTLRISSRFGRLVDGCFKLVPGAMVFSFDEFLQTLV